jgi:hypothetical protein
MGFVERVGRESLSGEMGMKNGVRMAPERPLYIFS